MPCNVSRHCFFLINYIMLLAMYKWKLIKKDEGLYTAPNFDTKIRTMFAMDKRKSKYTFYTLQFRVAMIENWPLVHIVNYSNENKCTKNDLPKFNMCTHWSRRPHSHPAQLRPDRSCIDTFLFCSSEALSLASSVD